MISGSIKIFHHYYTNILAVLFFLHSSKNVYFKFCIYGNIKREGFLWEHKIGSSIYQTFSLVFINLSTYLINPSYFIEGIINKLIAQWTKLKPFRRVIRKRTNKLTTKRRRKLINLNTLKKESAKAVKIAMMKILSFIFKISLKRERKVLQRTKSQKDRKARKKGGGNLSHYQKINKMVKKKSIHVSCKVLKLQSPRKEEDRKEAQTRTNKKKRSPKFPNNLNAWKKYNPRKKKLLPSKTNLSLVAVS